MNGVVVCLAGDAVTGGALAFPHCAQAAFDVHDGPEREVLVMPHDGDLVVWSGVAPSGVRNSTMVAHRALRVLHGVKFVFEVHW